jgi:hypothetical protein
MPDAKQHLLPEGVQGDKGFDPDDLLKYVA